MKGLNGIMRGLPAGQYNRTAVSFLLELLLSVRKLEGSYLEIGSFLGRSSAVIGMEAQAEKAKLYCVDIWDPEERKKSGIKTAWSNDLAGTFMKNMRDRHLANMVVPIRKSSMSVLRDWTLPLRFVHIDGNHDYKYIYEDTDWKRHLVTGGIICFHDYCPPAAGVRKAVDEEVAMDRRFERIGIRHSLIAFRKRVK